ncbi:MAG TPA: FAD-dependent thymidylate synthase, partial [Candidatus Thermoplasmatota archaeon]|nr:FAD-dependent thymidylate synthase [Candidatus Thermoplasmatota archaeon]
HELDQVGRLDVPHDDRIALVARIQAKVPSPDVRMALEAFADLARQRAATDSRIAHSIYEAGHHTPFQHPTFVFAIEGVSRNCVESFLHNHTFYNSEQQSQRYVEMKQAAVHVPASVRADPAARATYEAAVLHAWGAYHALRERLADANFRTMAAIGKIKGQSEKEVRKEAEKKSQEMARYVVPIAAGTQLYHTVSGIVLLRYIRMCEAANTPREARRIVEQMVEEVRRVDPAFVAEIQETPRPRADTIEAQLAEAAAVAAPSPLPLDEPALLLNATPDAPRLVAAAVREVTGSTLPDRDLLARVLDPALNAAWGDTLNTWDHSPVLRSLRHVHYTFRKRISLSAYAQDQRHRMTPGTRPLLAQCLRPKPDVHVPGIVAEDPEALAIYNAAIQTLWSAMLRLRDVHGIPADDATYLLPNATHVHFHQSGDLLSFIHKWRLRLCFNAQKEIFDASLAELRQVQAIHPELTAFLGPPCTFVALRQPAELQDSVEACCPEGPRWCGIKVWKTFDAQKGVPKRPY